MKTSHLSKVLLTLITPLTLITLSQADIVVPGADGSDGPLIHTEGTPQEPVTITIDLSQAVTGTWDDNNAANAGKGIYDPEKWAVVFKYSSVEIGAHTTIKFKNHASRAPVVWLVNGDVKIWGTVSLDGQPYQPAPHLSEPGPGGFRGGMLNHSPGVGTSAGFGPGGGQRDAKGGGYATAQTNDSIYGNPSLIPLIGGSGGSGWSGGGAGGAGGGAILIASTSTVHIDGTCKANGSNGQHWDRGRYAGGGSGGGIRIVCSKLEGTGKLHTLAAVAGDTGGSGVGRIRVERVQNENTIETVPNPSIVPLASDATAQLWPPTGSPSVAVLSVGTLNAPADPRASFGTEGADVSLPEASSTIVVVQTTNVEPESTVKVRITPRHSRNFTTVLATRVDPPVSTDPLTYNWEATVPVSHGYSAVQATAIRP